jgi:LysM repeat protein
MFADLPLGISEAQAAYFDGYNGGLDQYGRIVTAPFGIDLSFDVAKDIGLPPNKNDWIQVSYMWTESWDATDRSSRSSSKPGVTQAQSQPVEVATPQADGRVIHVVQSGQTLWEIAVKYDVSLQDIYQLNGFSEGHVIRPGDELLIKSYQSNGELEETESIQEVDQTPLPTGVSSKYFDPTKTSVTKTPTILANRVSTREEINKEKQPVQITGRFSNSVFIQPVFIMIGVIVFLGIALMVVGTWMNRKD